MAKGNGDNVSILGLDLGTSSVGWCLLSGDPKLNKIIDMGVRIFPEGMDRTRGEKSLNQDRRIARSLRRQTYRRARRKTRVLHSLIEAGLLPESESEREDLWQLDPYALRARALEEKLPPYEFGRALYHLGQRRGYLSNRKTGDDKEDGKVAAGITAIDTAMREQRFATLGAYLHSLCTENPANDSDEAIQERARGRYTARRMYLDEFDVLWKKQQEHGAKLPGKAQRSQIWHAIFDQRPLKIQKHLVGNCQFEPDRKRAMAASLAAQEFRLWQNLNHLRVSQAGAPQRPLTDEERRLLYKHLATSAGLTWSKVRQKLGLYEDAEFNLERVRGKDLQGNQSAALVSSAIGKPAWKKLGERQHEQLVVELLTIEDTEALQRRLLGHWGFSVEQINKLIKNSKRLAKGYMHLSHKAIRKILPHMRRCYQELNKQEQHILKEAGRHLPDGHQGVSYADAMVLAGYHHSQKNRDRDYQRLPFPGKASLHVQHERVSQVIVNELRNPLVERAIYQVRQIVNAVIREYGLPTTIRLEMARDLKANRRQRETYTEKQKENEAANAKAAKALEEYLDGTPSYTDILKYRLWQECNRVCPYTGEAISMEALFGPNPQFEIEHIIPYSRCLDNSYANKTLCKVEENRKKGNLTPYEHYQGKPQFEEIQQRIKSLPYNKRRRFWMEQIDEEEFVSQQLNETRYIARKAHEYLQQLDCKVEPVNSGQLTALLRRAWNLNGLLSESGEKSRLDHRHHAVDALVVALTNVRTVQQLNRYTTTTDDARLRFHDYPEPLPNLRQQAAAMLDQIIVSHKPQRKIKGPLHDETLYGVTAPDDEGRVYSVVRKPLDSMNKAKQLEEIRDDRIRQLAIEHLEHHNGDFKKAFQDPENPFGMWTRKGEFRPIRNVRIQTARSVERIGRSPRHVWTRSNHHIAIYEVDSGNGEVKWVGETVSMLEAARRLQNDEPLIRTSRPGGGRFVMALHRNDMVSFEFNGQRNIYRVEQMDQNNRLCFRQHLDADVKERSRAINNRKAEPLRKMGLKKLTISLLGKIKENEQAHYRDQ
ncbi:MAG: hypothetical protein Tsb002_29690 [Wenzhouxiangellaceae bacterium]